MTDLLTKVDKSSGIIPFLAASLLLNVQVEQGLTISPHAPLIVVVVQVLIFITCLFRIRTRLNIFNILILSTWACLFIWSLMSSIWSNYPTLTVQRSLLVFGTGTMLLLLVYGDKHPTKTFIRISSILSYIGFLLSIYGIVLYLFGEIVLRNSQLMQVVEIGPLKLMQSVEGFYQNKLPFYRISSLMGNPNRFAIFLLYSILSTYLTYIVKNISYKRFVILMSIQFIALLMSFSRTGIGLVLVSILMIQILISQKRMHYFSKILMGLNAIILTYFLYIYLKNAIINPARSSLLAGREKIWSIGLDIIEKKPLNGIGFGISTETASMITGYSRSMHNLFLAVLVEIGLIGLFFLIVIWLIGTLSCISFIKTIGKTEHRYSCMVISGIILIMLIPYQIFEIISLRYSFFGLYWLYLIGFVTSVIKINRKIKIDSNVNKSDYMDSKSFISVTSTMS